MTVKETPGGFVYGQTSYFAALVSGTIYFGLAGPTKLKEKKRKEKKRKEEKKRKKEKEKEKQKREKREKEINLVVDSGLMTCDTFVDFASYRYRYRSTLGVLL